MVVDFKNTIAFFILVLFTTESFAQNKKPILERTITLSLKSEQTDAALNKIAKAADFSFSYNPGVIDLNEKISLNVNKATVREVLEQVFHHKINYTVKGNYIILLRKTPEPMVKKDESSYEIKGYVVNENGEKLSWVSVYDKKYLASAVTNEFGFFKIKLKKDVDRLYVNKQGYPDTTILISRENSFITIALSLPEVKAVTTPPIDTLSDLQQMPIFSNADQLANSENIKDTLYRKFQISFIPFAGTNGLLSANVINNYSLNILGGVSQGTNGIEVGGLFNFNRGDMKGMQIAGLLNAVGGKAEYLQIGGLSNVVRKNFNGVQIGGLINAVGGKMSGVQISGLAAVTQDTASALQVAGLFNVNRTSSDGAQIAGLINTINGNYHGLQISGMVNHVRDSLNGCQIGFVNYARHTTGSQIGFFNYAKTLSGIPLGFISYVEKGYHKLELSADEIFYTNISFRSGVPLFHNIVFAGIQPDTAELYVWTFGYGFGTTIKTGKVIWLDLDLTSQQIVKGNDFNSLRLNNKFYLGLDFQLSKKFSLFCGATYNGLLTEKGDVLYDSVRRKLPSTQMHNVENKYDLTTYFGWKAGLRFF